MQVEIKNREYTQWSFIDNKTKDIIDTELSPLTLKLFNGDIIDKTGIIIQSNYRDDNVIIPGVLILSKTYGRNSNNKSLYKCIPDNKQLPIFLIPYEDKHYSFSKNIINNYILFKFKEWNNEHPIGSILNTLGNVEDIKAFQEYQLYCKNLEFSLQKFTKETLKQLTNKGITDNNLSKYIITKNNNVIDDIDIFSIDPLGSKDFDDAFSIQQNENYIIISVYIANVPLIIDCLNLWLNFTNRVSTIYLPGNIKNMLPKSLSEGLCSLQEGKERFAFTMNIHLLKNKMCDIVNITFSNNLIKLRKNYVYEESILLSNPNYSILLEYTKKLQKQIPYLDEIKDSHDVVAYYMIFMNYESSKKMIEYNVGIFRATSFAKSTNETIEPPNELKNFIKGWKYEMNGYYCDNMEIKGHELIANGLSSYTHITSPIRRIVDIINLIELQRELGLFESSNSTLFAKDWLKKIEYINKSSKAIKKVQQNCVLLFRLINNPQTGRSYKGYVLEKTKYCKYDLIKYNVYIPELNMVSYFKTSNKDIQLYSQCDFIVCIIVKENILKKKIRLQLIGNF